MLIFVINEYFSNDHIEMTMVCKRKLFLMGTIYDYKRIKIKKKKWRQKMRINKCKEKPNATF